MPHITCQVLHGPDQITFIWSQGKQFFEPYALVGEVRQRFDQLAREGHGLLATGAALADLARTGLALHELLFQGPIGQEVRGWLESHQHTPLAILSDAPERLPAGILRATAGDDLDSFWGMRHALTQGRRVGTLGLRPYIHDPLVTLALDPGWEATLTDAERRRVELLTPRVCRSAAELKETLQGQAPDFLVIGARVEGECVLLGADRLRCADLSAMLADAESGSLAPIVFFAVEPKSAPAWSCFLAGANRSFAGFAAFDVPAPAGLQVDAISATLQRLLGQYLPLGEAMRQTRAQLGLPGLAWNTCAPPNVRVVRSGETLEPTGLRLYPLPDDPFHPLRPLEREARSLLVGRDHDIAALGRLIDSVETRGVLLHGPAGSGKASLVRAGLLPHLEEGLGFWVLRDRHETGPEEDMPTLAVRPGPDLAAALAEAITSFAATPYTYTTPTGRAVTVDLPAILEGIASRETRSEQIQDLSEPSASPSIGGQQTLFEAISQRPEALVEAWNALSAPLPRELVVAIEHGEDLAAAPENSVRLLTALTGVVRGRIIVSLRSEYLGAILERMPPLERGAWRLYALEELTREELVTILEAPGIEGPIPHTHQIPASKYEVRFDRESAGALVQRVLEIGRQRQMSAVTVLHIAAEAVRRAVVTNVSLRDVRRIPFASLVSHYLEDLARRAALGRPDRRALRPFLAALARTGSGGVMLEPLEPLPLCRVHWRGATPFEEVLPRIIQPEVGVLHVQQAPLAGRMQTLAGLSHHGWTALPAEVAEETEKRRFSLSKMIDALFIFVPLLLLACALTIFIMRRNATNELKQLESSFDKQVKEFIGNQTETYERRLEQMRAITQATFLPSAEQALRRGDALAARQFLQAFQPTQKEFDDRSFEWFYLWKQVSPEKAALEGQEEPVVALAASSDGDVLASADASGVLRLWNMKDAPQVGAVLGGYRGRVHALAFAPGDKEIAAACDDGALRVWPTTLGVNSPVRAAKETRVLGNHDDAATCLAFADAKTLVSGGADRKARVWDLTAGKQTAELDVETPVRAVAVGPDRKSFVVAAGKKAVLADLADGKKSKDISINDAARVEALAFVNDAILAIGTTESFSGQDQGRLHLWDLKSNKDTSSVLDHGNGISALAVWRDKGIVFTSGKDRVIRMWRAKDAKELRAMLGSLGEVRSLAVLETKGLLASAAHDNSVKLFDLATLLEPDAIAAHKGGVRALAMAPVRDLIASGGKDGLVKFWLPTSSEPIGSLKLDAPVSALEFALHDKQLVLATGTWSAANTGEAKLWKVALKGDKAEATAWHSLSDVATGVRSLAFDPAGKSIAIVAADPAVWLGDVATGKRKGILPVPPFARTDLTCVRFDPEGRHVVAGNLAGNLIFWNAAAENLEKVLSDAHGSAVRGLVLRPFRGMSSTCSVGDDMRFGRVVLTTDGRFGAVSEFRTNQFTHALAAGRDRVLVVGDEAGVVTFYDLHFDRETLRVPAHDGPVRAVAVAADQRLVASAGDDGMIRLYRGDLPKLPPTPIAVRAAPAEPEPNE